MWLPVVGLDRHTPQIGLKVLPAASKRAPHAHGAGMREALYRPLSEQHKTTAKTGRTATAK
jgi:hypothetical protein